MSFDLKMYEALRYELKVYEALRYGLCAFLPCVTHSVCARLVFATLTH